MTAGCSKRSFDAVALKREFPGLADPRLHYLDSAATAQMPDVVLDALRRFELEARANVHEGMHSRARAATDAYDQARGRVARFLNAGSNQEVVFTYGATSSINLLAHCFGGRLQPGEEILLSILEHHSNLVPWQRLAEWRGVVLRFLPMTPEGRLDLDRLDRELTSQCRLVALTHCSNVTGALTDVVRVVAAARAVGARVMLDGAQRAPHGPLDLRKLDVDFYAFSGHKAYGPTGIGVLWGRRELLEAMPPFMTGGQMIEEVTLTRAAFRAPPRRFEAGTPPIAAAVGLGAALDWMDKHYPIKIQAIVKCFSSIYGILPRHSIYHKKYLLRINCFLYCCNLIHHLLVYSQTTGSIYNHNRMIMVFCKLNTFPSNINSTFIFNISIHRHTNLLTQNP